jgi:hypothetical protein
MLNLIKETAQKVRNDEISQDDGRKLAVDYELAARAETAGLVAGGNINLFNMLMSAVSELNQACQENRLPKPPESFGLRMSAPADQFNESNELN